jgi:hypothetical protein
VLTVSGVPGVVLVVRPADWEGRFLMRVLPEVTGAGVRGFAEITPDQWIDMRTSRAVSVQTVREAARRAALLVTHGNWDDGRTSVRQPSWRWPAGQEMRFVRGDWYPLGQLPGSPLAGRLAGVEWDSLPPLTGIVPVARGEQDWVALSVRLGRRGAERPALLGRDSGGVRELTTAGSGLWRWGLRGGASREAYRALVAAGVDWLLGSDALRQRALLTATEVVPRGSPLVFRWSGEDKRDSLSLELRGTDSTFTRDLRFDADGVALLRLPPGVYRWQAPGVPGASGVAVVEAYSDEYHLNAVTAGEATGTRGLGVLLVNLRERWWIFVFVIAALVGEWAWRTRRGLP